MGDERRMQAKGGGRVYLPGRVGVLVREARANVRRIDRCLDAHDRRCWLCHAVTLGAGAPNGDVLGRIRCHQRRALVAAWCAEYDERVALEWLLGLVDDVPIHMLRDWGLVQEEVTRGGA